MSDSRMYELENIVWQEFGDNDDHIVSHPDDQNKHGIESENSKRLRCEIASIESNAAGKSASDNVIQRKDESRFCAVKEEKEIMLEKSARPHSSAAVISASCGGDSNRNTSQTTSDESMTYQKLACTNIGSTVCELNVDDSILDDQTASVENMMHHHQLNSASHTENDLGFFDQESTDLLCYGWPEMENFENVDEMFRSCDSIFGLEVDNDDELDWFSPSQAVIGSSDDASSNLNISESDPGGINNVVEFQEVYGSDNAGLVVDEIGKKLTPVDWKRDSQELSSDGSSIVMNTSCSNGCKAVPNIEGGPQVCSHVSQSKNQKPSESVGKRKEHSLSNENSSIHFGDLKKEGDLDQSLNFQCTLLEKTQQRQNIEPHDFLQTSIPLINSDTSHPSNLARPRSSIIKSKHNGVPPLSLMESSSTSNQMQAKESSHDVSFHHPSRYKRKERVRQRRLKVKRADSDPVSGQTQAPNLENEVEGQGEVNTSDSGIPGELDSSIVQRSSCVRSKVTVEESSFQQLQHVLEQLDMRTKLCIRDSLYRLAKSAEQRHKCMYPTSMSTDDKNPSRALISDELKKSVGFVDVETDTNPIDRSIAHLLFHRPPDPSAIATIDVGPMKSHTKVQAPKNGPVTAKKCVGEGETITLANIKPLKEASQKCEI